MNNLKQIIQKAPSNIEVVDALLNQNMFDFTKNYLYDVYQIYIDNGQFHKDDAILNLKQVKDYVCESIDISLE